MDGIERADTASEPPERNTPSGYFIAIIAVLGGTLLIPPFSLVFTWIGAMLLVALIVVLLIYRTRREQKRRLGVGCRGQFTMPIADSSAWNVGTGQSCLGDRHTAPTADSSALSHPWAELVPGAGSRQPI